MQDLREPEGGGNEKGEGRKGPPEGSRCDLCGQCGPVDHMAFLSREFDATDPEFIEHTKTLPERFRPKAGRVKLAVWAHAPGYGCNAE